MITGNAAGQMAPPMVVFAYQRLPAVISETVPKGWGIGISASGWMTGEIFYEYIANIFHPWCIENKIEFPVAMFLDGHSSHTTMALSDFCVEHKIELIPLPPNSTHITQPMDVALFRALKAAWKKAVTKWRMAHGGASLKKCDFAVVLKIALESMDVAKCLSSGFTCCGLSPFTPDAINFSKLLNNKQREVPKGRPVSQPTAGNNDHLSTIKFIESSLSIDIIEEFKIAEHAGDGWNGEERFKELFILWLNCRKLVSESGSTSTNMDIDEEPLVSY